uniref:SPX domain-containing protein n=1 Tax=Prymnesium polylepis TaxID=72548 RepID=A0A7S4MJY2_9EUKA
MKFGKLLRGTVDARMPQWREHVLQYKSLKQLIRQSMDQQARGASSEELVAAFTQLLDAEVGRVNNFYMDRIEEGVIILSALRQQGDGVVAAAAASIGLGLVEQRHACKQSLVTFHLNLLILQNYVALNFMAISKILKKWDKKLQLPLRTDYINAIVELPFYQCQSLGQLVEEAEKLFADLDAPAPIQMAPPQGSGRQAQRQPGQDQPQWRHQPGQLQAAFS